jgi:hypothetical protein
MSQPTKKTVANLKINEDWLSVLIALVIILIATLGLLGPNGIHITF